MNWNIFIFGIRESSGCESDKIKPEMLPKQDWAAIAHLDDSYTSVHIRHLEDVAPPKGTAWIRRMRHTAFIICIPYQLHRGHIVLVIEFVQMRKQEALVLNIKVNNSQPSFIFFGGRPTPTPLENCTSSHHLTACSRSNVCGACQDVQ